MSLSAEEIKLAEALSLLCQETGAMSGALQVGAILITHNLMISEPRARELVVSIDEMLGAYESAGRNLESTFFAFSDSVLLVVSGGTLRATLCFTRSSDRLNDAVAGCRRFLWQNRDNMLAAGAVAIRLDQQADQPLEEPDDALPALEYLPANEVVEKVTTTEASVWEVFRPQLKAVLSRVINSAQADRVIDETSRAFGHDRGVPNSGIRKISQEIIKQVPHQGKRSALLAEIGDILEDFNLP